MMIFSTGMAALRSGVPGIMGACARISSFVLLSHRCARRDILCAGGVPCPSSVPVADDCRRTCPPRPDANEQDLAEALDGALGRYLSSPGSGSAVRGRAGGAAWRRPRARRPGRTDGAATRTAADYAALVATSLTVPAGRGPARSRRFAGPAPDRLATCGRFGPRRGGGCCRRSSSGQTGSAARPGRGAAVAAGRPASVGVRRFLTGRRPELRLRGRDQSPSTGSPAAVTSASPELASGVRDRLL